MRPGQSDLTSPVVHSKQAMAEISQETDLILIKSELKPKNDNFIFR